MIEPGPDPVVHLHSNQLVRLRGDGADIARRIQRAMLEEKLQRLEPPRQPHQNAPRNPYEAQQCIHCGHSYASRPHAHIVCGAIPACPICGKTQMAWERTHHPGCAAASGYVQYPEQDDVNSSDFVVCGSIQCDVLESTRHMNQNNVNRSG